MLSEAKHLLLRLAEKQILRAVYPEPLRRAQSLP